MSKSLYRRGFNGRYRFEKIHPFSSDLDKTIGILFLAVHAFPRR